MAGCPDAPNVEITIERIRRKNHGVGELNESPAGV
jgi:hypothetical protein